MTMTNECEVCKNVITDYEYVYLRQKNVDTDTDNERYFCSIYCLLFALGIRDGQLEVEE